MNIQTDTHFSFSRICWSAVISGALVAIGLGFLLQLYSIAIGLSAYNFSSTGAATVAIGGLLGLLIGVMASMGVAGFVSGYLGRFFYSNHQGGVIYGFLTWSLALLLSAIMVLPLVHYTAFYNKFLTPTVSFTSSQDSTTSDQGMINLNQNNAPGVANPEVKISPNTLAGSSWMVFLLFFVGAISSCIGGCLGVGCKKEVEETSAYPNRESKRI